ncbi:anthranilate synthase component I family protein [Leifsonia sp. H3M29-4]|uniref:anthranilate synthase component I family protein n=1 Tax=Salinibacterium metalliresistens TaxID=3031321 RepID=UPI0023DA6ED9|nr:anthranilate synthase component I family protein [Salinibacterium metalliresistens]MDF1478847.1 anthranilate synthase component I family protein [Salinibacterium metalliresistens]
MRPRLHVASLGRWVDPALAYIALCGDRDDAFWLDSGPNATTGHSYLGRAAEVVTEFPHGVLAFLRGLERDVDTSAAPDGFRLGWVGWLGYELRAETMGVPVERELRYPAAAWMRVDRALAFDHATGEVLLLSLDDAQGWREEVEAALASVEPHRDLVPPASAERSADCAPPAVWAYSDERYLEMIAACQAAIREGDAYQLCLTTEASVDATPDPLATYLALRASSPTHHGALLRAGGVSVLSASPEQFLTVSPEGVIESRPIKGTRPRGDTEAGDWRQRERLITSEKERAENVMIVDLMRNDIARVSKVGSVAVTSLLAVESYAQVHQLVSTVRGELAEGLDRVDVIAACFPAGSMTGAPKRSATLILDALEQRARGIYSGAFGYLGLDGAVDLAMVIRSIVLDARGATVGAGGGITALSVPEEELAEAKLKAAALLAVLGAR